MSVVPCEAIVREHMSLVGDDFGCSPISDEQLLLTTPYTYADGDALELIAVPRGDRLMLTDDGEALTRLQLAGVNFESGRIREALSTTLKRLPVEHVDGELIVEGLMGTAGTLLMTLITAMREVDALQALRPSPRPVPFERRLLSHLQALSPAVQERPRLAGQSGTQYRLTAAVGEEGPIYVQAVAGGFSVAGSRSVNHAFRAFYDIDGRLEPFRKLAVLSQEAQAWRQGDIALLQRVAFIAGWWEREALDTFVLERRIPEGRLLFTSQPELA